MSDEGLEAMEPRGEAGAPVWMATFADMMSLLLCFFVLLLSFASIDIVKFRDMLGSLDEAFGVERADPGPFRASTSTPVDLLDQERTVESDAEADMAAASSEQDRELEARIRGVTEREELRGLVESVSGDRGLTLRIKGAFMFESGSDKVRLAGMALLDEIAAMAAQTDHRISIEGHTDDVPINSPEFQTNWHLSTARAVAGLLYLIGPGKLDPSRISATGYAHTRPIAWGQSDEARRENRRLEIVFHVGS